MDLRLILRPFESNRHCITCTAVARLMPAFMLRVSKKGDSHPYKGAAVHLVQALQWN